MRHHRHRIVRREVPDAGTPRSAVLRNLLDAAEQNYLLLAGLLPGLRVADVAELHMPYGDAAPVPVDLRVLERGPFTTLLEIVEHRAAEGWVPPLRAVVRLCHDARVAEVVEFDRHRRLQARYPYPNPDMLQPDEKIQVNRLLGEWLQHCLRHGLARDVNSCAT